MIVLTLICSVIRAVVQGLAHHPLRDLRFGINNSHTYVPAQIRLNFFEEEGSQNYRRFHC